MMMHFRRGRAKEPDGLKKEDVGRIRPSPSREHVLENAVGKNQCSSFVERDDGAA